MIVLVYIPSHFKTSSNENGIIHETSSQKIANILFLNTKKESINTSINYIVNPLFKP